MDPWLIVLLFAITSPLWAPALLVLVAMVGSAILVLVILASEAVSTWRNR